MEQPPESLTSLTVRAVAARCREESARPAEPRDLRYCFELFRRAIIGEDRAAWDALYAQYQALVRHWLGAVPEAEDLLQETFAAFSRAVTAERLAAGDFPTLVSLLAYLRTIAINRRITAARRAAREERAWLAWSELLRARTIAPEEHLDRQALAEYIAALVPDEIERLVLRLSYENGLKPREIAQLHPNHFADAEAVSRVKERLKKRLAQDPRLRRYVMG